MRAPEDQEDRDLKQKPTACAAQIQDVPRGHFQRPTH